MNTCSFLHIFMWCLLLDNAYFFFHQEIKMTHLNLFINLALRPLYYVLCGQCNILLSVLLVSV